MAREGETTGFLFIKHILRKVFFEDWTTKLIALAITLALWLGITGLSTPTTRRLANVPLSISYPPNTELTDSPPQSVGLVISGDKRSINQIGTSEQLLVSLDLSRLPPGDRMVELTSENVLNLPLGVKVQDIQPNKIQVRLENIESKEIPVTIDTTGALPPGFELYDKAASPVTVGIKGPSSFVRALSSLSTEKIDITGHKTDFVVRQVAVISSPKVTIANGTVDVSFRIGEKRVEKTFTVPVDDNSGRKAAITLYAGRTLLSEITPDDIKVTVDKGSSKPHVTLPDGFQAAQVKNARLL